MKKQYIKPEILFVDLITEGEFCCSHGYLCDCDDDDDDYDDDGSGSGGGTLAEANDYRLPIWQDD